MKKVLILFGGNSTEHYISCKSAKSILENIDQKLFDVTSVGINLENEWYIYNDNLKYLDDGDWIDKNTKKIDNIIEFLKQFDVVFPIIHGTNGEDGRLQGMLELFNIKFVGCNTISSAIGMDKEFSKYVFDKLNIPQVKYLVYSKNINIKNVEKSLKYPMIIKPANGGSSIGISKANNKKELAKAIEIAKKYDSKIIIEEFIKARELEIAVLQDKNLIISNPGEILSGNDWYDYDAKYNNENSKTIIPNDIPKNILLKLKEYAKKAFVGLNAKGFARIDFFYNEKTQQIFINEINTLPGFTNISMFPKLMENEKIPYKKLITKLIENA